MHVDIELFIIILPNKEIVVSLGKSWNKYVLNLRF